MYTKGETAGGWIHISHNGNPIALVHPNHVDKFLAAEDMYEALESLTFNVSNDGVPWTQTQQAIIAGRQALAKAGERCIP